MYTIPGTMMMVIMYQWVNKLMKMFDPTGSYPPPTFIEYMEVIDNPWKTSLPLIG